MTTDFEIKIQDKTPNINRATVQRKLSGDSLSSSNSGSQSSTPIHNNWMGENGAASSNGVASHVNGHGRAPSSSSVSTTSSPVSSRRGSFTPSHDTKTRLGFIADSPDALVIPSPRRVKNHMKSDIFGLNALTISGPSPSPTNPSQNGGNNGWINENGTVVPSNRNGSNGTLSSSASTASSPLARRRAVFSPDHDTKTRLGFVADQPDAKVISTPRRVKNHMKSDIFGLHSNGGNFKDEWKLNAITPKK